MESIFTLDNIVTLFMLILLQAVLGLDNLLYISLESKRAKEAQQARVRSLGIGMAIILRIALLFILIRVIAYFQDPVFGFDFTDILEGSFNLHSLIVLAGGIFIMYTAVKEIWHMLSLEVEEGLEVKHKSTNMIIFSIVIMNIVFSFDSILSAMALTDVFWVMATAIIIGGLLMIWLSGRVTTFLKKNRMYEVLGLFILFIVGIMLLSEGGHLAHLKLFGNEVTPMSKTTFYFVIVVLVVIDVVQSRYQKKLSRRV
ncbi:tellurium resistance protein TerC [Flavobacteriaceae bacterium TP-CH-4]|uniref:Tellurium resistance protein TerC n=1 Tax=Pelagihabitans pacificus TaxID=2696054 RepID=A0A967AVS7_9FLAO|nr:TerC family protein [Pelagihabitans pacificus]NHF59998.1 tellurium resistance protein TerC [Pelagihabitans pacificus]